MSKILIQIMLIKKHKDKTIKGTQSFNVVLLTIPIFTNKRKPLYYILKNIIDDRIRYNYWVLQTTHIVLFFKSTYPESRAPSLIWETLPRKAVKNENKYISIYIYI